MTYTAAQVAAMAGHIRTCEVCGADPEITAGLNEGLAPGEIADFIATGHDPAWLALLTREAR
ncbi:hypothetical protein [Streptosporangium sp. NPDC049644]|uniref:hypothetical protein n=1 Tax=Streptosporangium sp. NPDC049644 TaxID=3155507 RepID=UPI003445E8FC